jgi:hypothetical protein
MWKNGATPIMSDNDKARYSICAFGNEYPADGHLPLKVGEDMGVESILLDENGKVAVHTISFAGITIHDYESEVTTEQFFEEMSKTKVIIEYERQQRDARFQDVLKRSEAAYL